MEQKINKLLNSADLDLAKQNYLKHRFREPIFSIDEFKDFIKFKKIYIFGANLEGSGFKRFLKHKFNKEIFSFVDTRDFNNQIYKKTKVIKFEEFILKKINFEECFIIIASKNRDLRSLVIKKFQELGLKRKKNYVLGFELCDSLPTIEPVGSCNLKCPTCTVGIPDFYKGGLMKIDNYKKIIKKMKSDLPFFNSVYLYLWGEPLMHPKIADFINITHDEGLACDISTNLNLNKTLEQVIKAEPDILTLAVSGINENYEITHKGGKWKSFEDNLHKVNEYIDKYQSDIDVRLYYHIYNHNLQDDYDYCFNLAKKFNFQWLPIIAQLFPEHIYKNQVLGDPMPEEYLNIKDKLVYDYKDQIKRAYKNRNAFCPAFKCFPCIRWDSSVVHCSLMTKPTLTRNYLDISFEELKATRDNEETCINCMSKGVHRFFDVSYINIEKEGKIRKARYTKNL